jgi:large subunit ribosomal protein L15
MSVNLDTLHEAIEAGKLDPKFPINLRHLWEAGVVTGTYKKIARDHWGVKLLSRGSTTFDIPVTIEVQKASQDAIAAVEAAGGTIACKYYNKLGLRALMLPHKFDYIPRIPLPIPRVRKWYENPKNRGVLTKVDEEATEKHEEQQ